MNRFELYILLLEASTYLREGRLDLTELLAEASRTCDGSIYTGPPQNKV